MTQPLPDGRLARGERARAAVVEAVIDLIEAGELAPTAEQIAERAGVSTRLVFHHFRDLEDLFEATAAAQMARVVPSLRPVSADGPTGERVAAFVAERARLLERIAPVRRAALLREPTSPTVARRLAEVRAWKRAEVARVFAVEIAAAPAAERAPLAAALAAAASFSTWDELRRHQRLSIEAARAAMACAVAALVETPRRNHAKRPSPRR